MFYEPLFPLIQFESLTPSWRLRPGAPDGILMVLASFHNGSQSAACWRRLPPEHHLRRILSSYLDNFYRSRTHLSLDKHYPEDCAVHPGRLAVFRCRRPCSRRARHCQQHTRSFEHPEIQLNQMRNTANQSKSQFIRPSEWNLRGLHLPILLDAGLVWYPDGTRGRRADLLCDQK